MNTPDQIIAAYKSLFPEAVFGVDVVITVFKGVVVKIKSPRVVSDTELSTTIAGLVPITPILELSKLTIRRKFRGYGKEAAFDALLAAVPNAQKDWNDAGVLLSNDPMFVSNADAFKAALGLTDEQYADILTP